MIRFPYGISNFHAIRTEGYLYLDRTQHIPLLEEAGKQLVFLRPRRFGKSLLLSTLANYYDIKTADQFDTLFSGLEVGRNPTPEHNRYLILRWDFSKVSAQGSIDDIRSSLFEVLNQEFEGFIETYRDHLTSPVNIREDALATFMAVLNSVHLSGQQLYLLIDEYDNFANEVLVRDPHNSRRYQDLLEGEGILKSLFKIIKGSAAEGKIGRVFITGVSPLVLADMTSGYNVATDISLMPRFNALCGITQLELGGLVTGVLQHCKQDENQRDGLLQTLKQFYNGYRFCDQLDKPLLYNPILCFYFLRHYQDECKAPRQMLDGNLMMDAARIRYLATQPSGTGVVERILDEENTITLDILETRFGVEKLADLQQDERYLLSLLYYFGVLTIVDTDILGKLTLGIPNLVTRALYVDELRQRILPAPKDRIAVANMAEKFYQSADLQPLADYLEQKYFAAFNNRDYAWSNELTIKTAFLTLLFNDIYYVVDSETALQRRYADLVLVIRPSMRQYPTLKDIVLEFKYLSLSDLKLTGEQVREQSRESLAQLPAVQAALNAALQQLQHYRSVLAEKYQEPQRLHCIAVIALGFDRVVWQAL
ncbi:AAA family ATPase [Thiothrix fructosivorans]|uniref:AAA family ATPase n=1 Tax=Thiothrix fructosivorans TaxID=111770 RepID=A0A8B0SP62_9GAMM|nr:AAA family ATPase [Thiothrix fructosivorans]MBO0611445.1 AAA family ATPase [Thiothrix fructosivorans]QTX12995.1 AAA family ATPase [Thiothrix fructosivorans]